MAEYHSINDLVKLSADNNQELWQVVLTGQARDKLMSERDVFAQMKKMYQAMKNADEPTGNLDSKSGKIVIDALKDINEHMGKTIIMVTHDPQMASYCSRIILLKDGQILEELKREKDQDAFYHRIVDKMQEL